MFCFPPRDACACSTSWLSLCWSPSVDWELAIKGSSGLSVMMPCRCCCSCRGTECYQVRFASRKTTADGGLVRGAVGLKDDDLLASDIEDDDVQ